jgi:gluconate kinase
MLWLQIIRILPKGGYAKNSLSLVSCRHLKNAYLEQLLETYSAVFQ